MSMTLIAHIELTTTTASIEFTSIPADYTDLFVVASLRNNGTGGGGYLKLNGVLASYRTLLGEGSGAGQTQTSDLSGVSVPSSFTANTFSNMTFHIPNYTSSNSKSVSFDGVLENNATVNILGISAALVATGSAVSTLEFYSNNGSLVQYSSATLFGITAGSDGTTTVS